MQRATVKAAAELLANRTHRKAFRPSYSRGNPRLDIDYNVFYFGTGTSAPRAVLRGSRLYVNAPGLGLPRGVESYDSDEGKRTRIGAFHCRLTLHDPSALPVLKKLIHEILRASSSRQRR